MTAEFLKSVLLDLAILQPRDQVESATKRRVMENILVQIIELTMR